MKNYMLYTLSICLISAISFLVTEKAFSQTARKGENTTAVKGITPGRAKALIAVAVGLTSLIVGLSARRRAVRQIGPGKGKNGAMVALILGLAGIILSILHLSTSVGAVFGSGSGKAGAIVALILSLIGITFSWLALRYKKINTNLN